MTKEILKVVYKKFGYFLMFLLLVGIILNGFSAINAWVALPLVGIMICIQITVAVIVEFNEDGDIFWKTFLGRFMKPDVLGASLAIIIYIGACNNWLDMV